MSAICLSLAPILRCQSLTRLESGILFIPVGLEVIFSVSLIFAKRGPDRKHYLLAAEGIVYFILALVDFLLHDAVTRPALSFFKGFDIFLGTASALPLLCYTLFLYMFTTMEIFPVFPLRLQAVVKYSLLLFIPCIVITNAIGSFIGISYHSLLTQAGAPIIAVGFKNEPVRTFFDSLTLVLLVAYQATNFSAASVRMVKAFINQRRIDSTANGSDKEVHLFNGVAWIAAGMKLGAIEPIIGFAQGGFGEALTRRIIRGLARACLIIGVVKGLDTSEDFEIFKPKPKEGGDRRRSLLRVMIANPRYSTFQQTGGYHFEPPPNPDDQSFLPIMSTKSRSPITYGGSPSPRTSRPPSALVSFPSNQRVVVHTPRHRAPTLEMRRLSKFDVPPSLKSADDVLTVTLPARPKPAITRRQSMSNIETLSASTVTFVNPPDIMQRSGMAASARRRARYTIGPMESPNPAKDDIEKNFVSSEINLRESQVSVYSTTDSIDAVRTLASQFPGIPPRITRKSQLPPLPLVPPPAPPRQPLSTRASTADFLSMVTVSRSVSQVTQLSHATSKTNTLVRRSSSVKRKAVPPPPPLPSKVIDGDDDNISVDPSRMTMSSGQRLSVKTVSSSVPSRSSTTTRRQRGVGLLGIPPLPSTLNTPASRLSFATIYSGVVPPLSPNSNRRHTVPESAISHSASQDTHRTSGTTLEFPWIGNGQRERDIEAEAELELEAARKRSGLARIKSVGAVPRRRTPTPIRTDLYERVSIVAEWFDTTHTGGNASASAKKSGFDGSQTSPSVYGDFLSRKSTTTTQATRAYEAGEDFLDWR